MGFIVNNSTGDSLQAMRVLRVPLRQQFCNDFTIACRVRLLVAPSTTLGANCVSLTDNGSPNTIAYIAYDDNNRAIVVSGGENAPGHATKFARDGGSNYYVGKWVSLIGVQDGSDAAAGLAVWVNNTEVATAVPWVSQGGGYPTQVKIGGGRMEIADVAFWDSALATRQIAQYVSGTSPKNIRSVALLNHWELSGADDLVMDEGPEHNAHLIRYHAIYRPDPFTRARNRRAFAMKAPAASTFSSSFFRENAGLGAAGAGPFARANAGLGAIA